MDILEIPVIYKNKEFSFQAYVVRFCYVNHIIVDLDSVQITIERDEEGNYRTLGDSGKIKDSEVEVDLIKEIIRVLELL